jgi:hypothetical protein
MLEPCEKSDQERSRIQVDHEALGSMMKSWLVPRMTGILRQPGQTELPENKLSSTDVHFEGRNLKSP